MGDSVSNKGGSIWWMTLEEAPNRSSCFIPCLPVLGFRFHSTHLFSTLLSLLLLFQVPSLLFITLFLLLLLLISLCGHKLHTQTSNQLRQEIENKHVCNVGGRENWIKVIIKPNELRASLSYIRPYPTLKKIIGKISTMIMERLLIRFKFPFLWVIQSVSNLVKFPGAKTYCWPVVLTQSSSQY